VTLQPALFDVHDSGVASPRERALARQPGPEGYQPEPPPDLRGERAVILNAETSGLRWWDEDRPIGWAYLFPESGRRGYLPVRHRVGPNLPIEQVTNWLRGLRGLRVENINTKFDLHMARADGADLVEQGCTFGDVAHRAALLDDHRMRFNLDQLAADILGWNVEATPLGKLPPGLESEKEFQHLHAGLVAPYAVRNVEQVEALVRAFAPQIEAEELGEVLALEEQIIPVVVEIEKNGCYIDLELLTQWHQQAQEQRERLLWDIYQQTGVLLDSASSGPQLQKLFTALKIPFDSLPRTPKNQPSFTGIALGNIKHPVVEQLVQIRHLTDFISDYSGKYIRAARADGWLRTNLHQLRAMKGDGDEAGARGAVSGRFSSAGDKEGGYNQQQVVSVDKQLERGWCPDFPVRRAFLPGSPEERRANPTLRWFAADAKQIEYRLFAHYTNSPKIIGAYHAPPPYKFVQVKGKDVPVTGPDADYHVVVQLMLETVWPDIGRKRTKNTNFAKIYGAGLVKFAYMLGMITEAQFQELYPLGKDAWSRSELIEAKKLNDQYNQMFPEVQPLLRKASRTAEERGYVLTLLKRRARFGDRNMRYHSALNRIIQGGAADVNKRVLVEVYRHRKELEITLRTTVHDEVGGDLHNPEQAARLLGVLNYQYFDLRVPILWDLGYGANWADAKEHSTKIEPDFVLINHDTTKTGAYHEDPNNPERFKITNTNNRG
jgi:DNA polymerase I-like protein with 3'-5' exonuclease and polymerase domains